jgi:DNA-binding MarR family transcriptional regulator
MALQLVPPIHRTTHRIGLYLASLGEHGLSQGESHILAQLASGTPATIKELHSGLAHKRSTLTSILDRLTERGFVTRHVAATDRRTFVIRPTARGRQVAARVHRHLEALERSVAGRFSPEEVRAFTKVLAAVEEEAHNKARPRGHKVKRQQSTVASRS